MVPPMRALLAALVGLATALAGCLGEAEPPAEPPPGDPGTGTTPPPEEPLDPAAHEPLVERFQGSVAGVLAPPPVGLYLRAGGDGNRFDFDLPMGAVAVVVEVAWDGSDALDLLLDPPEEACTSNDPAGLTGECPEVPRDQDGQSVARVVLSDPVLLNLTGTWSFGVWARQSAQPVSFEAAVSVFFALPPETYSAFAPAA